VISRANVLGGLGVVMTGSVTLIWNGQPFGSTATTVADGFAVIFSVAFFAAFALAMIDQRSREKPTGSPE